MRLGGIPWLDRDRAVRQGESVAASAAEKIKSKIILRMYVLQSEQTKKAL